MLVRLFLVFADRRLRKKNVHVYSKSLALFKLLFAYSAKRRVAYQNKCLIYFLQNLYIMSIKTVQIISKNKVTTGNSFIASFMG